MPVLDVFLKYIGSTNSSKKAIYSPLNKATNCPRFSSKVRRLPEIHCLISIPGLIFLAWYFYYALKVLFLSPLTHSQIIENF